MIINKMEIKSGFPGIFVYSSLSGAGGEIRIGILCQQQFSWSRRWDLIQRENEIMIEFKKSDFLHFRNLHISHMIAYIIRHNEHFHHLITFPIILKEIWNHVNTFLEKVKFRLFCRKFSKLFFEIFSVKKMKILKNAQNDLKCREK